MARTNIIADADIAPGTREAVLARANDPDWSPFFHVVPAESGLSRTIFVTQDDRYPYLIVAGQPGRAVQPPGDSLVVPLGRLATPHDDVNRWLDANACLLQPVADQTLGVDEFYDKMVRPGRDVAAAMVNFRKQMTGLPMVVYCSTKNSSHDVRIKVSTRSDDKFRPEQIVVLAVRPHVHYPDTEAGRLTEADFDIVRRWIDANTTAIADYWNETIDTETFKSRLKKV